MRRFYFFLPFVVLLALGGYFIWGLGTDRRPDSIGSPHVGKTPPVFSLPMIAGMRGEGLSTGDLQGNTPTVVNFFASWCVPCQAEHPQITRLANEENIRVVGINYKDKAEDARGWLQELGNPYDAIGADTNGDVGFDWGLSGVPETFILDEQGIIRYHHAGPIDADTLKKDILPAIEDLQ